MRADINPKIIDSYVHKGKYGAGDQETRYDSSLVLHAERRGVPAELIESDEKGA